MRKILLIISLILLGASTAYAQQLIMNGINNPSVSILPPPFTQITWGNGTNVTWGNGTLATWSQ